MLGRFVILGSVMLLTLPGCGAAKIASLGNAFRGIATVSRASKAASAVARVSQTAARTGSVATRASQTAKSTSMLRSGVRAGRATDDELLLLLRNGQHDEFVSQFRHRMHVDAGQVDESAKAASRLSNEPPSLFHVLHDAHRAGDLTDKLLFPANNRKDEH